MALRPMKIKRRFHRSHRHGVKSRRERILESRRETKQRVSSARQSVDASQLTLDAADDRTSSDNNAEGTSSKSIFTRTLDRAEYGEHGAAFLSGNYYPVTHEVTASCCLNDRKAADDKPEMYISGQIPNDFPLGQFAYVGPNPKFSVDNYKRWGRGPGQQDFGLGAGWHHWFEGDGMIYATDFCSGEKVRFRNRFIRTKSWERETRVGRRLFRPLMNADGKTFLANALSNFLQSGMFMKDSANTALLHFSGRTFALQDTCPPWELHPETLDTISACSFDGQLPSYVPFTAHPKILPATGELVFFGFNPVSPPHCTVGTLTPQGEVSSMNPLWSLPFVGSIFMHDFCITEHFTIIFEGSMDIKPLRQVFGKHPLQYNEEKKARFGVINRGVSASDVTWFSCSSAQMVYHFVNAWEEYNAQGEQMIVIVGVREDGFFHAAMRSNGASAWVKQAVKTGCKIPRVHEWRINLVTGEVSEQYIFQDALEIPRINDQFVGKRSRYAYAGRILMSELETTTQLKFDAVVKMDLEERSTIVYEHGLNKYGMEAQFVPRPGAEAEDDGWLVMYVHDESNMSADFHGSTQCVIIDAQNVEAGPVATISLPERVPYGAHCMWRADLKCPGETFSGAASTVDACTVTSKVQPLNKPHPFAFTDSQRPELLEAILVGLSRAALGLFVHGWSPRLTWDDSEEYAFIRGGGLRFKELNRLGNHRLMQAKCEDSLEDLTETTLELHVVENDSSCRLVREVLSILDLAYVCKPCRRRVDTSGLLASQNMEGNSQAVPCLRDSRNAGIERFGADDIIQYLYEEYLDGAKPPFLVSFIGSFSKTESFETRAATTRYCSSSPCVQNASVKQPVVFWAYEASPFCAIVRKILHELEIVHIVLPCARGSPRRTTLYRRTGSFQVPFLEDPNTGVSLFESKDIVEYLKSVYSTNGKPASQAESESSG